MIEYLLSLILGLTLGMLVEKSKHAKSGKELVSKGMTLSLFLLIFFLGFDIGRKLDLQEMAQVGKLSVIFALTTMAFSYAISKILTIRVR